MPKMLKINEKFYKHPHIDFLTEDRIKKLEPKLKDFAEQESISAMYDLVSFMLPEAPRKDVGSLMLGDVKHILANAGLAQFEGIATDESQITVGESSAS